MAAPISATQQLATHDASPEWFLCHSVIPARHSDAPNAANIRLGRLITDPRKPTNTIGKSPLLLASSPLVTKTVCELQPKHIFVTRNGHRAGLAATLERLEFPKSQHSKRRTLRPALPKMFGIEFVDTATFKLNEAFNTNKGTWGLGLWERIRYSRTSVYMIVGVKIGYASRDQWRKYSHNINNHIDVGALYSTSARHVETAEIVEAMPIIFAYRLAKCHDLKMAHLRNPQSFVTGADLVELPTHTKFSMTDIAPKPLTEFLSKHSPANRPESRPHKPGTEDVLLGRLQSESPVSMSSKHSSLSSVATSDVDIDRQAPSRSTTWSSYGPKREDRNVRFSLQSMPEYPTTDYQDGAKVVRYDEAKPGETKSTEIRNDDDVVMQMALQFPTMAMTLLEKNYDTLISILRASSPENTFKILAGYDISPVGALIDDEDKDFFTGTRETIWLETSHFVISDLDDVVEKIAKAVRPCPVSVFQESDQKILFVHDNSSELNTVSSDLLAATTSTADHPQDAIPLDNSQPSDAESPLSVQIIYPRGEPPERQSSQDAEKDEQRTRGPAGSWSHNAESSAGTFTPKREDFSGEPPIGPEGVKSRNNVPFVGILTVEDSKGIEQSIKIIFELEINTPLAPADQNQVITHASMGNLEMELPLPTSKGRSITTLPKVPHLRAQNVEVKVRPSGQQDQYVLTSQHPKKDFLNGNVTAVSETGVTINSVASLTPALHLGVIKKVGEHKERLAASEAFDTANIEIGEDNGAHFWDYPLKYTQTYNSAISLPTHCSTGIYYRNKPVAAVTFLVQACLEINQDARPKRLSKSQIKPCRSTPKLLQLGYKQVKMCFSVVIKKEVHKNFMELQGRDRTGSTVRLHHKFLSTPVDSINETETSSENPLADATVTLKAKKN